MKKYGSEVSEDAISRRGIKIRLGKRFSDDPSRIMEIVKETVDDAPSVVPTARENRTTEQSSMVGEWIACTKEGLPLTELGRKERQKWYGYKCPKCNFIYKGNALTESPFCQNCGEKMRLE